MSDHHLYVVADEMDRLIKWCLRHVVVHQVKKTVLRLVCGAVEVYSKSSLKIREVLHHSLYIFHIICEVTEHLLVRDELHECTVLFCSCSATFLNLLTSAEACICTFAVTEGLDIEI